MRKLILVIFIFVGCSKKEKEEDKPKTPIKVLETVTNLPVGGADLVLFTSIWGGAYGRTLFQGVTDDKGICQVPSENYSDATSEMNVVKAKYWPFLTQKNTIVYMTPEGWLKLRIHQVGNYPAGSVLNLKMVSESGRQENTYYNDAVDSLISIKAFGNEQNKIEWQVVDASNNLVTYGTTNWLQIPRFDTLKNVILEY
jgi:hypothetical protein